MCYWILGWVGDLCHIDALFSLNRLKILMPHAVRVERILVLGPAFQETLFLLQNKVPSQAITVIFFSSITSQNRSNMTKNRTLHGSRRYWRFLGTWSHSHIGSSLLFMWWRFLFVCLGSCFILILYVFGLWFSDLSILNYVLGYGHCPYLSLSRFSGVL